MALRGGSGSRKFFHAMRKYHPSLKLSASFRNAALPTPFVFFLLRKEMGPINHVRMAYP